MTTAAWLFSAARLSAVYPCLSRRSIFWPSDSAFATLGASPSAAALKKATAFGSIAAASSSEMAERRGLSEAFRAAGAGVVAGVVDFLREPKSEPISEPLREPGLSSFGAGAARRSRKGTAPPMASGMFVRA